MDNTKSERIDILYNAVDQIAQSILKNQIPMSAKEIDPNSDFEPCSWPETYLRYKEKVKKAEIAFNRRPLTDRQWWTVEAYLDSQYGLKLKD